MKEKIQQLISFCQSTDVDIRKNAEMELEQLEALEEYPVSLVKLAILPTIEIHIRQASLIMLKKYVLSHWSLAFEEFRGPVPNQYIKNKIRAVLLDLISSDSSIVTNAAVHVVSKIASIDWPDEWPELFNNIMSKLSENSENHMNGGLKVLKELIDDAFTNEYFFSISPTLIKLLYNICSNEQAILVLILLSLLNYLNSLEMIKETNSEVINVLVTEAFDLWINLFIVIISKNIITTLNCEFIHFKLNIIKVLHKIRQTFLSQLVKHLPNIFQILWAEIEQLKEMYSEYYILNSYESDHENDSDGDSISLSALLAEEFLFTQISLRNKIIQKTLDLLSCSKDLSLRKIINLSVFYSQISLPQDELNESSRCTVRQASVDFIEELASYSLVSTKKILMEEFELITSGLDFQWRYKEAILFVISRILKNFDVSEKRNITDLSMSYYNTKNYPEFYILQVNGESLILLLEVLFSVIKINRDIVFYSESTVISVLFKIIMCNSNDPYLIGIIQDIFEDLAENVSNFSLFCEIIIFPLKELLSSKISNTLETQLVEVSFDLLYSVIKGGTTPLSIKFLEEIIPGLIHVMKNCDNNESAEEVLRQIILKDYTKLVNIKYETGISVFDEIMSIIGILLERSASESANFFIGPLIIAMMYKAGGNFQHHLPSLLETIVARLTYSSSSCFCQEMLLIFAHLLINQAKETVDFLYMIKLNGISGLDILLKSWCENIDIIHGYKNIRLSSVAMANLFMLQDSRLSNIIVKGDLIINRSEEIITRSKTKLNSEKYTLISFPIKIIKILLKELSTFININNKKSSEFFKPNFLNLEDDWEDLSSQDKISTILDYSDDSMEDPLKDLDLEQSQDNKYSQKSLLGFGKAIDESRKCFKPSRSLAIYHKHWRPTILGFKKSSLLRFSTKSSSYSSKFFDKNDKDLDIDSVLRTKTITSFDSKLSENIYISSHTAKVDSFKIFKSKPHLYLKEKANIFGNTFSVNSDLKRSSLNSCISSLADEMNNTEIRILLERDQKRKKNKTSEKIQSSDFRQKHSSIVETLDDFSSNSISLNQVLDKQIKNYNLGFNEQGNFVDFPLKYNNDTHIFKNINDSHIYYFKNIDQNAIPASIMLNNNHNNLQKTKEVTFLLEEDNFNSQIKNKVNNQQETSFIDKNIQSYLHDQNIQENSFDFKHPKLFLSNYFVENNSQNENKFISRSSLTSFSQPYILQQISLLELHKDLQRLLEKDSVNENPFYVANIDLKADNTESCNLPTVFDPPFSMILSPSKFNSSDL
ncbi:hypothetical protein PMAC_002331 [Pneumocystis sp. 'macacae']|nr:hypothetical protein PMAC_002331 [Pneumocystis sp. 'macacae']